MYTGSFTGLLDTWVGLLRETNDLDYTRIITYPHGGRVERLGELRDIGLVTSRLGTKGGHKLTLPFNQITLSHLMPLRPLPPCPTTALLNRYANKTMTEILSWTSPRRVGWAASLGAVAGVLSHLNHSTTTRHVDVQIDCMSHGYKLQVLYRAFRLGLTVHGGVSSYESGRRGVVLYKPFSQFTVGDVIPLLTPSFTIYNALLERSRNIKLKTLLKEGV